MLTITQKQLAYFDEVAQKRYYEDLRKLLRESFPQLVSRFDNSALLDRIAAGVERARAYGILTGTGILAYVGLSLAAGPAFNSDPKIRHFLELPGNDPDRKVQWLFLRVVETLRHGPHK